MPNSSTRASARWISRILPVGLAAILGFATYVFVARICHSYLLRERHRTGTAIALLILYFVFFLLVVASYIRLLVIIKFDAGVVPLSPEAEQQRRHNEKDFWSQQPVDPATSFASVPYTNTNPGLAEQGARDTRKQGPGILPPGLEHFYSKDVFVCDSDGRPRWCPECAGYKPDRTHHSSEIGRCVYKMDHYCPWVGGMVGQNSFKFFVQFNIYATCLCAITLGVSAYYLKEQVAKGSAGDMDSTIIASAAIGGFFGLFTFLMSFNTIRFVLLNLTQVDALGYKTKVYQLAVRVDNNVVSDSRFNLVRYPFNDQPAQTHATAVPSSSHGTNIGPAPIGEEGNDTNNVRDRFATRTFAILRTEAGENPWDLGYVRNFTSVMGTNPLDWVLPVRRSPCANHDRSDSYYELGPVVTELRRRYGVREVNNETDRAELKRMRQQMKKRKNSSRMVLMKMEKEREKGQGEFPRQDRSDREGGILR